MVFSCIHTYLAILLILSSTCQGFEHGWMSSAKICAPSKKGLAMNIMDEAWREIRARDIAGSPEQWQLQLQRNLVPKLQGSDIWAHPLNKPEQGALLITSTNPNFRSGSAFYNQKELKEGVLFITDHGPNLGTAGFFINKPTGYCAGEMFNKRELDPFFNNMVFLGGKHGPEGELVLMHSYRNLPKSQEVFPGICIGGDILEAAEMVRSGAASAKDFRLFLQHTAWGPQQLEKEIGEGSWYLAACSKEVLGSMPIIPGANVWRETMRLMGGRHGLVAREVYNEL